MKVVYSERIRKDSEDFPFLQETTNTLQKKLGASGANIRAEWDLNSDQGTSVYTLTISDSVSKVSTDFTAWDLKDPARLTLRLYRLNHLWGDFLESRWDKDFEKFVKAGKE